MRIISAFLDVCQTRALASCLGLKLANCVLVIGYLEDGFQVCGRFGLGNAVGVGMTVSCMNLIMFMYDVG